MSPKTGYSLQQIGLHWIMAILIGLQFALNEPIGQAWRAIRRGAEPLASPLVSLHVAIGIAVVALLMWRLALRLGQGVPPAPDSDGPALKFIAAATHWTLYGLMFLIPLSGAIAWFRGVAAAGDMHELLTTLLLVVVGLHIAAALAHHFVLKTDVLRRMMRPGT